MKVLIDMPVFDPLFNLLKKSPSLEVQLVDKPEERSRPLPADQIADVEILFCTVPPENYLVMSRLKMIQIASSGFNLLVGKGFEKRGVRVCNALGVFDVPIAEWNVAMMINLRRDLRSLIRNQDEKIWDRSPRFQGELRGLVVGIWGYGGIGRETARLAKALGMRIHVLTRSAIRHRSHTYSVAGTGDIEGIYPDHVFLMDEKREFLSGLDFLIMAIPQNESTVGIVGEKELQMLPPGAFVLNPARGPLIDEQSLLKALSEGWIAGAALDTHYHYPMPPDHPLWTMPNVMMTPHISGSSGSTRFLERVWDIFSQNVSRLQHDDVLLNELTHEQLNGRS